MTSEHQDINERYYRNRGCEQKRRWVSRDAARKNAKRASLMYKNGRISAYKCQYCNGFHIGHDKYAHAM